MKKTTSIYVYACICICTCLPVQAQVTGNIKAGFSMAQQSWIDYSLPELTTHMTPGFHVGGNVEVSISDNFSFETGILFQSKGTGVRNISSDYDPVYNETETISQRGNINLYYIDIPFSIKGLYKPGDNVAIYGMFGPYLGIGVFGNYRINYEYTLIEHDFGTTTTEQGVDKGNSSDGYWWGEDGNFSRIDAGLTIGAGIEIHKFIFGISYNMGLVDISTWDDETIRNRVLNISVGLRLGDR